MSSDVKLNDGSDASWVTVEANVLNVKGTDVILDSAARRGGHGGPFRRALVHDQSDGLTINFNNDYPGGVTINGLRASLRVLTQSTTPATARLPKDGAIGDLLVVEHVGDNEVVLMEPTTSLWLCEGRGRSLTLTSWRQIALGARVTGTE
ncbi:hypothetical protein [Rhodobacter ferrooxidans]|uniref:Uncharacterized protein n=1 Tax=Rhodobacter ferrooxidans TaxID=371731 RepID=C8RWB7_9RHOB|nr:hypothetical protein [Rhodobacter sp. SW2]EEW26860.1 conserved hypothetical protein [Rhodobacter sp. SW2]